MGARYPYSPRYAKVVGMSGAPSCDPSITINSKLNLERHEREDNPSYTPKIKLICAQPQKLDFEDLSPVPDPNKIISHTTNNNNNKRKISPTVAKIKNNMSDVR